MYEHLVIAICIGHTCKLKNNSYSLYPPHGLHPKSGGSNVREICSSLLHIIRTSSLIHLNSLGFSDQFTISISINTTHTHRET
ncbi:hypothetical protein QVD17_34050 [Tagetes erecta]|uniref:Uncharacterized protein n=1 Tax=Tagetes erecta TaxID=13708 RepID=A0AAD8JXB6_TARER|nr:hypothetical protein QVD17_34050 [Tagetes erecta]